MSTAPTDPMIGRLIDGRYQVRSRIARGGMATVYVATDLRLERRVAIKIMHGHLADESNFKERFVQEARSAARLAHPNVVNVFDQGQDSDMAYLVMEYLPGMTLRDLLKDYGTLTTEQTLDIMDAVLGGLAAAHKAGIVHRDLKPENVLLADDGRIKIGDFGLSRATSANTATGQALLGTIAYLSPELLTRGVADARSDIYAAGIMMYEMLTGKQPFTGDQPMQIAYKHANDVVPTPSDANPSVPGELDRLVAWSTNRDPADRPEDAAVMLEQLRITEQHLSALHAATTGVQRTVVMPAAIDHSLTSAQTQILTAGGVATAATTVAPTYGATPGQATGFAGPGGNDADTNLLGTRGQTNSPTDRLANTAKKRRKRGMWLIAIVVVLAVIAGGVGLYFSIGPGGKIAVPDVAGQSQATAQQSLQALGLAVALEEINDLDVPVGDAVKTDPPSGTDVAKDSKVTLFISAGPAIITLPQLIGAMEGDAKAAITGAGLVLGTTDTIYRDAAAGTVLDALDTDGASLAVDGTTEGVQYAQGQTVTLVVSAGGIPDVSGLSVDAATAALKAVGLNAASGEQVYSDTVPAGDVVSTSAASETVRPGETIQLQISRGPEPVAVPDVVGKSWLDAKSLLENAGFKLSYPAGADIVPALVTVTAVNPKAGTMLPKGSSLTVSVSF